MKFLLRLVILLFPTVLLAAPAPDIAEGTRARYSRISTVHLRATSEASFVSSNGQTQTTHVQYEYFASGDNWRIHSFSAPHVAELRPDTDVAWDGSEWQLFMPMLSELHLRCGEAPPSVPHPNPLFLPLAFLSAGNPGHMKMAELRGSAKANESYDVATTQVNGVSVPGRLVHHGGNGAKDLEIVAESFENRDPVGPVPMRVTVSGYGPDGTQIMHAVYSVVLLEINQTLSPDTFRIDPTKARTIYDGDTGVVLKSPDARLQGKTLEDAQKELKSKKK